MRRNWLLLAVLVGLAFSFYHLLLPYWLGSDNYSPLVINSQIPSLFADETITYAAKAREAMDGHIWLSDVNLWEYKNSLSPLKGDLVPALIMAGLGKLGAGIEWGFALADFFGPALAFLVTGYFIFLLTKKPYFSLAGALLIMIFSEYFRFFPFLPSMVKIAFQAVIEGSPADFSRSFHPQVTWIFFVFFMISLWQLLNDKLSSQKKLIWMGLSLGILFYTYLYFWVYAFAWLGIVVVFLWLQRNFKLAVKIIKATCLGLIIGLPYLITQGQFHQSALSQSFSQHYYLVEDFQPNKLLFLLLMFGLSGWLIKTKKLKLLWQSFYLAGLILMIMVSGLKIGLDSMNGHFQLRIIFLMNLIFLWLIISQRLKQDWRKLSLALIILLIGYQALAQGRFFKQRAQLFYLEPERRELFDWLNQQTAKDSVVVTSGLSDNIYLAVYTHNNIFIPRATLSIATDEEALTRMLLVYKTAGIPLSRVQEMFSLTENNKRLKQKHLIDYDECAGYYLYFRRFRNIDHYDCSVPEEQLAELTRQYQNTEPGFNNYRADYWLWGPYDQRWSEAKPQEFDNWPLVWENNSYQIYALP